MNAQTPRSRLVNLLSYLRRGDQLKIAERVRCDPSTVSAVLNGRTSQISPLAIDIIATAKEIVLRNNPYQYRK